MIATIIPAFNEPPDRLRAAVESARAISDLVVVADDGSRMPVDLDTEITVVRQANKGPAAAMNLGAERAIAMGATRLCRLDVGDSFRRDAKLRQLKRADSALFSPHFDLVEDKAFQPPAAWANRIYTDGVFCICTMVVSADVWHEVGGMDETLRYGDDWDFTMRVQRAIGWTMFPEVTCEAGAFDGGHTKTADRDPVKRQIKHDCLVRCLETGQRLKDRRNALQSCRPPIS